MAKRRIFIGAMLLMLWVQLCVAQQPVRPTALYPQHYFICPLKIPILLAGNFGECRPGHFHSGIDIKTKGKENLPVCASASGYISRIKLEKGGFGHALYVTHPNGYTTLYAHLNEFAPQVQRYVHAKQYELQKWDMDLTLGPNTFKVQQGDVIAFSGNTGASTAPHLHFEIRNTKTEHPLNPALFGFNIVDNIPPILREIAFYPIGFFGDTIRKPIYIPINKVQGKYVLANTPGTSMIGDTLLLPMDSLRLGIGSFDLMEGTDNTLTYYQASVGVDDTTILWQALDDIGYEETRYVNACADYQTKQIWQRWIQMVFQMPNNKLSKLYTQRTGFKDAIALVGYGARKIEIELLDANFNRTTLVFYAKRQKGVHQWPPLTGEYMPYNQPNFVKTATLKLALDETQLYDHIYFNWSTTEVDTLYSMVHQLQHYFVPVHHYFDLYLKPNRPVPFHLRNKMVMMYADNESVEGKAANSVDDGFYKAKYRNFGRFWLQIDTLPPTIKLLTDVQKPLTKHKKIVFEVRDVATKVKSFSGLIDNKWVCVEQHGNTFFYSFDEHCAPGSHTFVLKAADDNDNEATYTFDFIR